MDTMPTPDWEPPSVLLKKLARKSDKLLPEWDPLIKPHVDY